jgi:hypothetical protein
MDLVCITTHYAAHHTFCCPSVAERVKAAAEKDLDAVLAEFADKVPLSLPGHDFHCPHVSIAPHVWILSI